jgi:hypothetical protein
VEQIVILNRRQVALRARARSLVAEVSRDGKVWTLVHRGLSLFGQGADADDWPPLVLPLGGRVLVRFLRLSLDDPGGQAQHLHLGGVRVLARPGAVALARLWQEQGFDSAALAARSDPLDYRPLYDLLGTRSADPAPLTGLVVRPYGRFGNALLQTINAIVLARGLGLRVVRAMDFELFSLRAPVALDAAPAGPVLLPPLAADEPVPDGDRLLAGPFYHMQVFGRQFQTPDAGARRTITQDIILPHLDLPDVAAPPPDALVIHIRSGDIFGPNPHPGYAQPPLAFYTATLDRLQAGGAAIGSLVIVAEDRANPCIGALEEIARARGLPCRMQVGGTLGTDVAFLIQARHLVFGYGTFGYGICLLSGPLDSLTVFDTGEYNSLPHVAALAVVRCAPGSYIPRDGWTADQAQRDLMLCLPADRLVTTIVR